MARRPAYTEAQVRDAVAGARSIAEALRRLGLQPAGGNHLTLKKLIARYGLSTEHFDPYWAQHAQRAPRPATPLAQILVEQSTYHRNHLKRRLYDAGLKARVCEMCGQGEEWRGLSMAMILDHINGVPTDNRLENLRIVCPNCAATLDTHCGRKNRRDRDPRICLWCGNEFIPKYLRHRYCSPACGRHSTGPREPRPERRKVERPSYEQLMADVASMSFLAIGRKYGVSDTAIRKWISWYEHERESAAIEKPTLGEQAAAKPVISAAEASPEGVMPDERAA
jgi:transposase-like protein